MRLFSVKGLAMKERITPHLPASLKAAAEDFASKYGVSLNQFISMALAEKVGAHRASNFFAERSQDADAERAVRFLEGRPE
ncbi:pilus assembly protein HicB [Oceaniglobus roseus]|uniref:pilus assembly protein HicB n=1 Tax=Oceaniglobus roseus TaxID=1737570 RepID=UPI001300113C|nr:pilus assembly protein HicB [Kandeliimicrobium roseum]